MINMSRILGLLATLMFFLLSVSMWTFNIQLVNAAEGKTWIVDDDGPADFHTIQEAINAAENGDTIFVRNGMYYENLIINKTLILVGEENSATIVDGNQTEFVVSITSSSNVKVESFTFRNTNLLSDTQGFGIIAHNVTNCLIRGNLIHTNYYGIKLSSCSNATIINNIIKDNTLGIVSESSPNCTTRNNIVHNNLYRGILINNSDNCTICDNNAALGNYGINIEYSNNCTVKNNTATDTAYYGIQTYSSHGSKVNNNTVTENDNVGISIQYSMNCTISENIIRNSQDGGGIEISSSNDTQALDNTLDGNYQGIRLWQSNNCEIYNNQVNGSLNGVYIYSSNNSKLSYNTMKNNFYGLLLLSSNKSMLTANTLKDSLSYGIWTIDSNGNNLFHNNFVDNQVQIFTAISANIWNSSIEGNYWSDYTGVDQNSDGIGDQDYTINENNIDHFPLMGTLFSFNTSSGISIYTISNSTISNFNYEPHTTTIRFTVNGPDGTVGFCRIRIPHKLMNGTYYVTIDNVEPDLANYSLHDDGKNRWLYFAYEHSPHEVVIVSEFKSLTIMLLFMIITLLAVTVYERKVTSN